MWGSLASFRELKGVEPATEARLHAAGVFTWEALSQVAAALDSVRGASGESLQELSGRIAEHATAAASGPRPPARAARGTMTGERSLVTATRLTPRSRATGSAPSRSPGPSSRIWPAWSTCPGTSRSAATWSSPASRAAEP
jgi:hypothetical protein